MNGFGVGSTDKSKMPTTHVDDDELLYRRVPNKPENLQVVDGKRTVATSAFNCRFRQPSVNRCVLLPDPIDSKIEDTDGIVGVVAKNVREITSISRAAPATDFYRILVEARPILRDNLEGAAENLAHAQIESAPAMENNQRFRKLKEALAWLANQRPWIIEPS